jgi:hypothetical protein
MSAPPKWMFLVISLVIGVALFSPMDIINGQSDFWSIFGTIVGAICALYYLGIFIGMDREERKKC